VTLRDPVIYDVYQHAWKHIVDYRLSSRLTARFRRPRRRAKRESGAAASKVIALAARFARQRELGATAR
jgi:hypothetical protein